MPDEAGRPDEETPVIERRLTLPVEPERLWGALTDPDAASVWMGGRVEWELVPGAPARFEDGPTVRRGRIDIVERARRLRFQWWPDDPDGGDGASEVTYVLRPDGTGTELTVTERPLGPPEPGAPERGAAQASAAASTVAVAGSGWSEWDGRLLGVWAGAARACPVRA
jgi:uncharacterized protein YndB with AHSA1/START domain